MSSAIISLFNVSKIFGDKRVIDDVSFSIKNASITTILGQNGAGKSTIARLIVGLEKLSSGRIATSNNIKISYLPQRTNVLSLIPMNAEILLSILSCNKKKNAIDFSDFLQFDKIKSSDVRHLSFGEIQKLLLVGTLSVEADVFILDEPAQYLDVESQCKFYEIINKMRNDLGVAILLISHDLFTVIKSSDQIICLNNHVCCSGTPCDIQNNKELRDALSQIGFYMHHHDHKH